MKNGFVAAMLVALVSSVALAEDGLPSQSKLNKLGLSSMQAASDVAGEQVRGKGFAKLLFSWNAAAGEKVIIDPVTGAVSMDPANFIANDTNNGAGITEDGSPLTFGLADVQFAVIDAEATHQQAFVDGNGNTFTELSASTTRSTVVIGDATTAIALLGILNGQ